jgi:uncharacterized protein YciI
VHLVVRLLHGGSWDFGLDMREQAGWDEHARLMDELAGDGFIVLGGPLDERRVMLVVEADSAAEVGARLAADPWAQNGMLSIESIEPWTILLDGRAGTATP